MGNHLAVEMRSKALLLRMVDQDNQSYLAGMEGRRRLIVGTDGFCHVQINQDSDTPIRLALTIDHATQRLIGGERSQDKGQKRSTRR